MKFYESERIEVTLGDHGFFGRPIAPVEWKAARAAWPKFVEKKIAESTQIMKTETEDKLKAANLEIETLRGEVAELHEELSEERVDFNEAQIELNRTKDARNSAVEQTVSLRQKLSITESELNRAELRADAAKDEIERLKCELNTARAAADNARAERDTAAEIIAQFVVLAPESVRNAPGARFQLMSTNGPGGSLSLVFQDMGNWSFLPPVRLTVKPTRFSTFAEVKL